MASKWEDSSCINKIHTWSST